MADRQRMPSTPKRTAHQASTNSQEGESPRREDRTERRRSRSRSRSPRRDQTRDTDPRPRKKDSGFRWKEKRRDDNESDNHHRDRDRRDDRNSTLNRGYRDHYRPRSRSPPPKGPSEPPSQRVTGEKESKPRPASESSDRREKKDKENKDKEKKEKKLATPARPTEPMILVYVNDRLGTKKAIPCFASDPVKDFKVIVASMIGRQPHEILLKRQGERPFKDQLTLQDYGGLSNTMAKWCQLSERGVLPLKKKPNEPR